MDQSIYDKLNEAYSVAIRSMVPPALYDFREIMLKTFIVPFTLDEFNKILEVEGENTLILKIGIEINERIDRVFNTAPQFNRDIYFDLVDNIHTAAMDFLLKDNFADSSQKLAGVDYAKDKIDNIFFLANKKPDKHTKRYFKILDKNKERLLNTNTSQPAEETLHYWPYESGKLKLLIDDLVKHNLIEASQDYILTFKEKEMHKRPRINWVGKPQIALLILLFYIYDKSLTFERESILDIAWKLFKLDQETYSTRQYFNAKKHQFGDPSYMSKKHSILHSIIMKLELKKA